MKSPLRSDIFDDVYFSAADGLAETRHVFLVGNNLPQNWVGRDDFTIFETGFGTGLNFLAALHLWRNSKNDERPKRLHFMSVELYPLERDVIRDALAHWPELKEELGLLLNIYPAELKAGQYSLKVMEDVDLKLFLGDVNEILPSIDAKVDCWFLDGFKPVNNPQMWSETVFSNMARLSAPSASFATFTAAGFVRRSLAAVGFDVSKVKGFGTKRDMSVGNFCP